MVSGNRMLASVMVAGIVLGVGSNVVRADPIIPLDDNQNRGNQLEIVKGQLDNVLNQIKDKESEIQKIDNEIITLMEEIKKYDRMIKDTEQEKSILESDIKYLQIELDKINDILKNRLRVYQTNYLYDSGLKLWLKVIFESESLTDLIDRVHASITIMKADKSLMDSYKETKKELETKKEELDLKLKELNNYYVGLDLKRSDLEHLKKKTKEEMGNLSKLKKELETKYEEEYNKMVKEENEEIRKKMEGVINTLTSGETDSKIKQLIEEALKYQGVPYVWGGVTPQGFDCSGYMQYIFKAIGVDLPRLSVDQKDMGIQVPIEDIKAGDLIFRYGETNHIALYIGNGLYIHAPRTGDVVKISKFNPSYWDVVTRVVYTDEDVQKYVINNIDNY